MPVIVDVDELMYEFMAADSDPTDDDMPAIVDVDELTYELMPDASATIWVDMAPISKVGAAVGEKEGARVASEQLEIQAGYSLGHQLPKVTPLVTVADAVGFCPVESTQQVCLLCDAFLKV
mmetsp:Transcript_167/g.415  ORF Transcript_167/g.415 Transcript_167/m.415 type:complete len:121 (+) Transcript_167:371-733(+)